jgi:cell wall-associated NlpC family hydrolase
MQKSPAVISAVLLACLCHTAHAEPAPTQASVIDRPVIEAPATSATLANQARAISLLERAASGATSLADAALAFLGVSYRFGGTSPDLGFDCSGLVRRVFQDALGLNLPRTAREMSQMGTQVRMEDLKPGDLVFFNTMRAAFSHVGIYLGDNKFVHAPSSGGVVRVEDMRIRYWTQRFDGARRLDTNAQN